MSQAVLFDSQRPGERFSGQLRLTASGVVFEGAERTCELGVDHLACRTGGIQNQTVYFSHPDFPGVEVVTQDFALLSSPLLAGLPAVRAAVASSRGYKNRYWGGLGLMGCLALMAVLVGAGIVVSLLRFVFGLL